MNKLFAKTGYVAAASALLTTFGSLQEAQALTVNNGPIGEVKVESLFFATALVNSAVLNKTSPYPTAGEVGEFVYGEVKTFAEFDISFIRDLKEAQDASLADDDTENDDYRYRDLSEFKLGFNIASLTGAPGAFGSDQGGATESSPFTGMVNVSWYRGSAIDNLIFNPDTPGMFNPLLDFSMEGRSVGDRINIDENKVERLVRTLIDNVDDNSFGIVLTAELDDPGVCGPHPDVEVDPENPEAHFCSGFIADGFIVDVPTPAAVLPTLMGFASAAFRKNKENEQGSEA